MKPSQIFVSEIAEQISMPEIYSEIRQMIENQDSGIQDFVDIIEQDQMLSIRLMRIANSHYFGYPGRAMDLYQTISLIGIMQLHDLVLNCLCLRTFASVPRQIFNMKSFWKYSIEAAIASRTIAQYGQIFPINPYFTVGLLHEVGHAVMYVREPELASEALDAARQDNAPLIEKEQELFGFDYTEVGRALMQHWQLPARFQQASAYHLQPQRADEAHQTAINIVNLAHQICDNSSPAQNRQLIDEAKRRDPELNRLPDNINNIIIKEMQANTDNVLNILWPLQSQMDADDNPAGG